MSNPRQVDNAKERSKIQPRGEHTSPALIPTCMGMWEPIGVEIVTEAEEYAMEPNYDAPPVSRME